MSETVLFIGLTKPKENIKTLQVHCPVTHETVLIRTTNNVFTHCCFDNQSVPCKKCKLKPENNQQKLPKRKRLYQTNFKKTAEQLTQKLATIPTIETWVK